MEEIKSEAHWTSMPQSEHAFVWSQRESACWLPEDDVAVGTGKGDNATFV